MVISLPFALSRGTILAPTARFAGLVWVKLRRTRPEHISSALPPIATEERTFRIGSSVPTTDIAVPLFDHLVGALLKQRRHVETQRLGRLEIDH
jgi:hypothetical protein